MSSGAMEYIPSFRILVVAPFYNLPDLACCFFINTIALQGNFEFDLRVISARNNNSVHVRRIAILVNLT